MKYRTKRAATAYNSGPTSLNLPLATLSRTYVTTPAPMPFEMEQANRPPPTRPPHDAPVVWDAASYSSAALISAMSRLAHATASSRVGSTSSPVVSAAYRASHPRRAATNGGQA